MNRSVTAARRLSVMVAILCSLAGCGLQSQKKLDAADLRFASFYGDYLARIGQAPEGKAEPLPELNAVGLDSLFARHGLDQKTFDAKLQAYSRDPELWRKVLEQVRTNLRKTP